MKRDWDNLRFFLALVDHGTLAQAADRLNVSHTTVLRRIKALETDLQTRLFEQSSTGYLLTASGTALELEAKKVERSMTNISRKIVGADQQLAGDVIITTTDTIGYKLLPAIVADLQRSYPQISVHLQIGNTLTNMSRREADIALRTVLEPPLNLIGRKVCEFDFIACASTELISRYQLHNSPQNAADCPHIVLNQSYKNATFYPWMASAIAKSDEFRTPVVTVNAMLNAYALCRSGIGIALLPAYLVQFDSRLQTVNTDPAVPNNFLWMLNHSDLRDTARVKMVKQFLFESLRKKLSAVDH